MKSFDENVCALSAGDAIRVRVDNKERVFVVLRREGAAGEKIVFSRSVDIKNPEYTGPRRFSPHTWDGKYLRDVENDIVSWFTEKNVTVEKDAGIEIVRRYEQIPRGNDSSVQFSENDWSRFADDNADKIALFTAVVQNEEVPNMGGIVAAGCKIFEIPPTKNRIAVIIAIAGIFHAVTMMRQTSLLGIIGMVAPPSEEKIGDNKPTTMH